MSVPTLVTKTVTKNLHGGGGGGEMGHIYNCPKGRLVPFNSDGDGDGNCFGKGLVMVMEIVSGRVSWG